MIIQTLVVSAAECLSNGIQLLQIFEAEEMFSKIREKLFYSKLRYMRHEKIGKKLFPYKMWL